MKKFLLPALAMSAVLVACVMQHDKHHSSGEEIKKPNVLIVLTDDQGYGDLSVNGNPSLETPNLDKLHNESIRFTDYHVAPMCAPTRGQLMTGIDCLKNGCYCTSMGHSTVHDTIPFMSEIFSGSGYTTGLFGKWHMGYNYPHRPMDKGFDEVVYFNGYGLTGMGHYWNSDYFDPYYYHNGKLTQGEGYCNDIWFDKAMKWMKTKHEENTPFFCMIPTNLPHGPAWVDTVYSKQYNDSGAKDFYGMIANVDENMGKLVKFLDKNGLRENTVLIFTTDNGTIRSKVYNAGMKGGKCSRFDGGHRVPCFVSWPGGGLIEPTDISTPTQVQDILPTLIDICKLEKPGNSEFDGKSLLPLLKGRHFEDRMFVVQYQQNDLKKYDAAVVWKNWRLVLPWGDQLFDICADPGQENIISDQHPEIVKKMKDFYEDWWAETKPHLDKIVYNRIGTNHQQEVILNSSDWFEVRADGNGSPRKASARPKTGTEFTGGIWYIDVEKTGKYEVELRRYPREADATICGEIPPFTPRFGEPLPAGIPLNVTKAHLETSDGELTNEVTESDKSSTFVVHFEKGKTKIRTWFSNEKNPLVSGAYYAYIKLKVE